MAQILAHGRADGKTEETRAPAAERNDDAPGLERYRFANGPVHVALRHLQFLHHLAWRQSHAKKSVRSI